MSWTLVCKTWFVGRHIGTDQFNNKYFVHKNNFNKRWVLFFKKNEATTISGNWYRFLHHLTDRIPEGDESVEDFLPNLTGTPLAHKPKMTPVKTYQAWRPD